MVKSKIINVDINNKRFQDAQTLINAELAEFGDSIVNVQLKTITYGFQLIIFYRETERAEEPNKLEEKLTNLESRLDKLEHYVTH